MPIDEPAGKFGEHVEKYLNTYPVSAKERRLLPEDMVLSWQSIVDTVAELCRVPAALITRLDHPEMEVLTSSRSEGNPYRAGDREPLEGRFCQKVVQSRQMLLVTNSSNDHTRDANPDIKPDTNRGMLAYLGFPVLWPDGEAFGTLCILDSKKNSFSKRTQRLMAGFRRLLEAQLAFLYRMSHDRMRFSLILDSLEDGVMVHDVKRRILYFNRAAAKITGFQREEILGKDCHAFFGKPFCGMGCSRCGEDGEDLERAEDSLIVKTKNGKPRHVEINVSTMKNAGQSAVGTLVVFRDVTAALDLRLAPKKIISFGNIIGKDAKMLEVFQQIRDVTEYDFPVHITGETGTGKELVARAVHNESRRHNAPFVPINCGALPEGLIESELFGHVKGAFSGAIREKMGRFELAAGGTVFLDEVADLPKLLQVKILRFLQEGCFEKVGGEKTISVDVRVISATNKDLKKEVLDGNFREDLFYRLKVIPIWVPPLRERNRDIPLLVQHFLQEYSGQAKDSSGKVSTAAMAAMLDYTWPGNVRELQNVIQFFIVRSKGKTIRMEDLPREIRAFRAARPRRGARGKLSVDAVKEALKTTGGNKSKAARLLKVGRATLYRFIGDHPELM